MPRGRGRAALDSAMASLALVLRLHGHGCGSAALVSKRGDARACAGARHLDRRAAATSGAPRRGHAMRAAPARHRRAHGLGARASAGAREQWSRGCCDTHTTAWPMVTRGPASAREAVAPSLSQADAWGARPPASVGTHGQSAPFARQSPLINPGSQHSAEAVRSSWFRSGLISRAGGARRARAGVGAPACRARPGHAQDLRRRDASA